MKSALVCGGGGFIGSHLVKRLKREGFWVRAIDLKFPEFSETEADDFIIADLRNAENCRDAVDRRFDEVYQLAADMGGAGYIFTGENDADIMHNSALINLDTSCVCSQLRHGVFGKRYTTSGTAKLLGLALRINKGSR
jgi:nucleoside-diphosphate-sugar epimerase